MINFTLERYMVKNHLEILKNILLLVVVCTATTGLSIVLNRTGIGKENTLMIFLLGVLAVTVLTSGYAYGIVASVISLLMFNFFFTEPLHSLIISHAQDYILMIFFFIASIITGTLSSKFRMQSAMAIKNGKTAKILYDISESFLNLSGAEKILKTGIDSIQKYTGFECAAVLDQRKFDGKDLVYATQGYENTSEQKKPQIVVPIKGMASRLGNIKVEGVSGTLNHDIEMLIRAITYQMALVLDREFIYYERERIKIDMESEHVKTTLLRSISHDLRTPLTGIIGASSLMMESGEHLDKEDFAKLASDINEEATWLFNSVQNILDMTRITDKKIVLKKDYEVVEEVIEQALNQLPWLKKSSRFKVTIPSDIILIKMDGRLMVQVFVNLLDNAHKHTTDETQIELKVYVEHEHIIIQIIDDGPGIDDGISNSIFESFVTIPRNVADGHHGVGLGLAICKTIVEAHGGTIEASKGTEKGTIFTIKLPCE
jgi:two-component system sensor histidine kinase KdpD